ncbi:MAG: Rrf2 family transcriptional regulator [Actinobacteria bacterium]|nr:Rrf2 family transcriptional regulator [Actinomycetota bacterium]
MSFGPKERRGPATDRARRGIENVNLSLTRRGDYVVRAAHSLARAHSEDGGYRKIREVAEEMSLPLGYTPQILALLARAGIAESRAGRQGGYRLRRDPEEISMLEVVEAGEGPLAFERCALRGGPCRWEDVCALHPTWSRAAEAVRTTLAHTTLADVVAVDRRMESGELRIDDRPAHRARRKGAGRNRASGTGT